MKKIINLKRAKRLIDSIKNRGKTIVLVGGCFDILHLGHLKFLKAAKKQGDILIIALESDENVKKLKGPNRPINSQKERASLLAALEIVDYVLLLGKMKTHQDYFDLVKYLKPDVIGVTKDDPYLEFKKQQAKVVGAKVKIIIKRLKKFSTSKILKGENTNHLNYENFRN